MSKVVTTDKLYAILHFLLQEPNNKKRDSKKSKRKNNGVKLNFSDDFLNWRRVLPYHVRNAVVSHRWNVIGYYLPALIHMTDVLPHYVWKIGFSALCNNSEASDQDKLKFISTTLQLTGTISLLPILDSSVYLLCNGSFDEAYKLISTHFNIKQPKESNKRYVSYLRGFQGIAAALQCFKKLKECNATVETTDNRDEIRFARSDASTLAEASIKHFASAFKTGYVWDNMVEVYCEVLLHRDESVDEIARILQDYIIKKPNHPTSYVLLITFLKNYCPEETADLIQALKDLVSRCPSDARVIQLCKLLGENELRSQFMMMTNMVDYYKWKDSVMVWQQLSRVVRRLLRDSDEDDRKFLKDFWHKRSTWWPMYHFGNMTADEKAKPKLIKLIRYKTEVRDCLEEFEKKATIYSKRQKRSTNSDERSNKRKKKSHKHDTERSKRKKKN